MNYYDEQLRQLQVQCARKKKLEVTTGELRSQREAFTRRVQELRQILLREQADVDRLEGHSLAAFFYNVMGKMDEKRTKEQQEAYAAQVKYDAAARELAVIEADLNRYQRELDSLEDCERRYAAVFQEKTQAVKQAGGIPGAKILNLEARSAYLDSQEKELQEAIAAGNAALDSADQVLSSLDSAEGWGTYDLIGGGFLADLAKHSHLDDAQASVEDLQSQLRRFKTELADVTIHADLQVNLEGFLRFADYVFDGLFVDWTVLDHIHRSQEQVQTTREQIYRVLNRLHAMVDQVEAEQNTIREEIQQLVHSVAM